MKVALVCDWYHPRVGGIELHLQDLATHLQRAGHDVVVITPTPGEGVVNGTRVIRIDTPLAPHFGFLMTPGGVRAIGDVIARERVDVAHCHVSIVSPAALGGASQAVQQGTPTVLTFHSMVPQTGVLALAVERAFGTGRWPVRFSAVSALIAREVQPVAGGKPISVLSNGIDAAFWRVTAAPRAESDTLEAISVMRLDPKKRPAALVDMMVRLRELLPVSRVRLRIVGDGPERSRLEGYIARRDLADQIEVLGRQSREEIRLLLSTSDLFVLPTVRESFGLAALEARCAGLPVVAIKASGVSEFIRHDVEGLLAASDDELAAHVAALATDSARRLRIATHNRNTTAGYDWATVLEQHLAIYREAIALRDSVAAENAT